MAAIHPRAQSPPAHLILTEDIILQRCPGAPPRKKHKSRMRRSYRYQPHDIALDLNSSELHSLSALKPRKLFDDDAPTEQSTTTAAPQGSHVVASLASTFRPLSISEEVREEPPAQGEDRNDDTNTSSRTNPSNS